MGGGNNGIPSQQQSPQQQQGGQQAPAQQGPGPQLPGGSYKMNLDPKIGSTFGPSALGPIPTPWSNAPWHIGSPCLICRLVTIPVLPYTVLNLEYLPPSALESVPRRVARIQLRSGGRFQLIPDNVYSAKAKQICRED